jgi:hypothetical protein
VSQAIINGADSLKKNISFMISFILSRQQADGRWKSNLPDNDVQSSVYALLTLLNTRDNDNPEVKSAIEKGIQFIRSKAVKVERETYWHGGIYFSGGTEARETQVWKSDAVTTALCLEALVKYQHFQVLEDSVRKE